MSRGRERYAWVFVFVADIAAVVMAYMTTYFLRFRSAAGEAFFARLNQVLGVRETGYLGPGFELFYAESAPRIVLLLVLTLVPLYALRNLYAGRRFIRRRPEAWNVLVANLIAMALFYIYFYLRRNVFHPRSMIATILAWNVFFCVGFRVWMKSLLDWCRHRGLLAPCRAILIGRNREADLIASLCDALHPYGLVIVGRLDAPGDGDIAAFLEGLRTRCRDENIAMLICADHEMELAHIMLLLELGEELDVPVKILSAKLDVIVNQARLPSDRFRGIPLLHFERPPSDVSLNRVRRVLTRGVAVGLLVVLAPVLAVIALLIRLGGPGPVFFLQERIGVNRKPFRMFKFRTMHDRAEEWQAQMEAFNESADGLFKMKRDPRVTWIGRFLRRFSLDELPQLINIARGEMVFVGPRPLPQRDFAHYYEEWHYSRHAGVPGLTCLWQVSGRSDLDFHSMCILDVYYLRNRDWMLDVQILLRTVWVVLFARGAY